MLNNSSKEKKRQENLRREQAMLMSKKVLKVEEDGIEVLDVELVGVKRKLVKSIPTPPRSRSRSLFPRHPAPFTNTSADPISIADSDDEDRTPLPPKRPKLSPPTFTPAPAAIDLDDEPGPSNRRREITPIDIIWTALPQRSQQAVADLDVGLAQMRLEESRRNQSQDIRIHSGRFQPEETGARWEEPQRLHLFCEELSKRTAMISRPRPQDHRARLNYTSDACSVFLQTINKILQHKEWTFVASAVAGGHVNQGPDEVVNAYNQPGSLVTWKGLEPLVLNGHSRKTPFPKHYTVNDVGLCPTADGSHFLVSAGNDYQLKLVESVSVSRTPKFKDMKTSRIAPMDIAVKPGEPMFAVAAHHVHIHSEHTRWKQRSSTNQVGMRCDFVSPVCCSESLEDIGEQTASHKAFDVAHEAESFTFDLREDGDALAVDPLGLSSFIYTGMSVTELQSSPSKRDPNAKDEEEAENVGIRTLRLYDVRHKDGREIDQLTLESSEVKYASFSPDGIYLAVGRADGHIHVYDSRNFDRLLYDFSHRRNLHNNRLGLLSGGPDGCVRLWQPHCAPRTKQQGKIIAQVNADVGYFSVGNRFEGEHDLVVGDGDGEISFFDNLGNI
ncbi:hypothetical protein BT96DRAFT_912434 [Gymnopus androsaceus JB14]|uniref:Uncharacterized protein n=1 Tax=Gymnopus androsaceus JB14 TaxID=1447944 RepID=A0A6A4ITX2_9AGAR|nr:hypothetical protein BT96DRAFT_912434 [Gymnopus androsaceus JB14]